MGSPLIWGPSKALNLTDEIESNSGQRIIQGVATDPSSSATAGEAGSILSNTSGKIYVKTDTGSSTNWDLIDATTVAALYTTNNGDTMTNGAAEVVCFEDSVYDTHSAVSFTDFATQDWVFTAPMDGYYHYDVSLVLTSAAWDAGETLNLDLQVNSAFNRYIILWEAQASETIYVPFCGSGDVYLDEDDTLRVVLTQNSGGDIALWNQVANVISIHKIRG